MCEITAIHTTTLMTEAMQPGRMKDKDRLSLGMALYNAAIKLWFMQMFGSISCLSHNLIA